jgi:hypothetical protein
MVSGAPIYRGLPSWLCEDMAKKDASMLFRQLSFLGAQ